jgi:pSer/pThr/pTyr-binding forkhead associated (FHA) protein
MPYLQLNERQFALRVGETRVGGGADVDVLVPGSDAAVQAVVDLSRESAVSIRRAGPSSAVRVNGVQLGAEPTPLIHGDKIEVGGSELFYGDDRKGGSTQFISSINLPDFKNLKPPAPGKATLASGGRVISLVDGREYQIPSAGISFGRDAGCDVVIPSSEVSRRHAEIAPGDVGYVLSDTSTNGIFVNGQRVDAMQVLGRGDVLRIGTEEFRFYADQASANAAPAPKAEPVVQSAASMAPTPAVAAPFPRQALATLEVVGTSPMKGQTFSVISVLANVGRGPHNDIVIVEESVSDSHAKLQRRDGVWYVTDLGSTNGTYIGGRRISAEERLPTDADLRFGGVPLVFHATVVEHVTEPKVGTRMIQVEEIKRASPAPAAPRPRPAAPPPPVPAPKSAGVPWWAWAAAAAVVGGAAFFALRMH